MTTKINLRLDDGLLRDLQSVAKGQGRTVSDLAREGIAAAVANAQPTDTPACHLLRAGAALRLALEEIEQSGDSYGHHLAISGLKLLIDQADKMRKEASNA